MTLNDLFRTTVTIDLPIQEEPVLESLCEKTNTEMGPSLFGVSNSERRSLLETIQTTEEGAEILKSRSTLTNFISDVKRVGSGLKLSASRLGEKSKLSDSSQTSMRSRASRRSKAQHSESRNTFKGIVASIISHRETADVEKRRTIHEIQKKDNDESKEI